MTPALSIVTGHWNRLNSIDRLVRSIGRTTRCRWEVVIADCSDTPADSARWPEWREQVRIVRDWPKTTMVSGYNRAFREARGEWVAWLNDDAEVIGDTLDRAVRWMEMNEDVGMGALYYACEDGPWHVNTAWGIGYANFGILRRSLGERVGWFDDCLAMYGCDNSITFKVLLEGRGVVGVPHTRILHHDREGDAAQRRSNWGMQEQDQRRLLAQYGPRMTDLVARYQRFAHLQGPLQVRRLDRWGEGS